MCGCNGANVCFYHLFRPERPIRMSIGDGNNGTRMGEGEFVYARMENGDRVYLGTIRIDDDGTPYLNYEQNPEN